MIETPQSFVIAEECRKLAWQNRYRRPLGERDGWGGYGSTTAQGLPSLHPAPGSLRSTTPASLPNWAWPRPRCRAPDSHAMSSRTLGVLYAVMPRVYELGRQPTGCAAQDLSCCGPQPTHDDRGRAPRRPARRPGHPSRPPFGLLAGLLSFNGHHRYGPVACLAPNPVGGLRDGRRAARRAQRPVALRTLGCCVRSRADDF